MKTSILFVCLFFISSLVFSQTSQPVVSVFPLKGNYGDRVTAAIYSGLTASKRVRLVDREKLDLTDEEMQIYSRGDVTKEGPIIKGASKVGATHIISGNVTNVSFGSKQSSGTYYYTCDVEVHLMITSIETGVSESKTLFGSSSSSDRVDNDERLSIALRTLTANARTYVRQYFPTTVQIIEITEQNDKKGIVEILVEGEGLTEKSGQSSTPFVSLGEKRTRIEISYESDVTRLDGTMRTRLEKVAEAKILKVEDGGSESPTALCKVIEGGKRLQELLNQKARLILKTTN